MDEEGVIDFEPADKHVEILVGPMSRSDIKHLLQAMTVETSFKKDEDKKKSKSTKTLQISVHNEVILNEDGIASIWPDALRMRGEMFGVDTVSGKFVSPFTGILLQCTDDSQSRLLAALKDTHVEGLEPGQSHTVQFDGHEAESATSGMKSGIMFHITANKIYFEFGEDDGEDEDTVDDSYCVESTSIVLYDGEPLSFGEYLLSGVITENPSFLGPPMCFPGSVFFSMFLLRHTFGGGTKTFNITLHKGFGTCYFSMDTKVNELQERHSSLDAQWGDSYIEFGIPHCGEDAMAEMVDVSDPTSLDRLFASEPSVPVQRKRKRVTAESKFQESIKGSTKMWHRSLDLTKVFRALNPIQEKIACTWIVPFDSFFIFLIPLQDGTIFSLSLSCAVEENE
jgi:hypothetical protein